MAKFYIIDEPETNKLWLIDLEQRSVECLDRDVINSTGRAGSDFLATIGGQRTIVADNVRSDPLERAYSFDGRSDPSERAYSFDGRSDPSERAYSFDGRSDPSERAYSFDGRSDPSERAYSCDGRINPSDKSFSAGPAAIN